MRSRNIILLSSTFISTYSASLVAYLDTKGHSVECCSQHKTTPIHNFQHHSPRLATAIYCMFRSCIMSRTRYINMNTMFVFATRNTFRIRNHTVGGVIINKDRNHTYNPDTITKGL